MWATPTCAGGGGPGPYSWPTPLKVRAYVQSPIICVPNAGPHRVRLHPALPAGRVQRGVQRRARPARQRCPAQGGRFRVRTEGLRSVFWIHILPLAFFPPSVSIPTLGGVNTRKRKNYRTCKLSGLGLSSSVPARTSGRNNSSSNLIKFTWLNYVNIYRIFPIFLSAVPSPSTTRTS